MFPTRLRRAEGRTARNKQILFWAAARVLRDLSGAVRISCYSAPGHVQGGDEASRSPITFGSEFRPSVWTRANRQPQVSRCAPSTEVGSASLLFYPKPDHRPKGTWPPRPRIESSRVRSVGLHKCVYEALYSPAPGISSLREAVGESGFCDIAARIPILKGRWHVFVLHISYGAVPPLLCVGCPAVSTTCTCPGQVICREDRIVPQARIEDVPSANFPGPRVVRLTV